MQEHRSHQIANSLHIVRLDRMEQLHNLMISLLIKIHQRSIELIILQTQIQARTDQQGDMLIVEKFHGLQLSEHHATEVDF